MKSYLIDDLMMNRAKEWAEYFVNNHSIRIDGYNIVVGSLGEIIFNDTYTEAKRISNIDFQADFIWNGKRIDVKTKDTTIDPKPYYEVTIPSYQLYNRVDYYFFYYFNRVSKTIWSIGWLPKKRFFEVARFMKKGDIEPFNNWTISEDCYIAKISDLNTPTR